MSWQCGLSKDEQEIILKILKNHDIDCTPREQVVNDDGTRTPIHRDVVIYVSDYDDESEEFDMTVQVD